MFDGLFKQRCVDVPEEALGDVRLSVLKLVRVIQFAQLSDHPRFGYTSKGIKFLRSCQFPSAYLLLQHSVLAGLMIKANEPNGMFAVIDEYSFSPLFRHPGKMPGPSSLSGLKYNKLIYRTLLKTD